MIAVKTGLLLPAVFLTLLYASAEPDWSVLTTDDTMTIFTKDMAIGRKINSIEIDSVERRIIVRNQETINGSNRTPGAVPAMDLSETRIYDFSANLISARQKLLSSGGVTEWDLNRRPDTGVWILDVRTGDIVNSRTINAIADNLRSSYAVQKGILERTVKKGDAWKDTVFDMTSATQLVIVSRCIAVPDSTQRYYVFTNTDDVMKREERCEIDTAGKTVIQEVQPFFTMKRTGSTQSEIAAESQVRGSASQLVTAFAIPAKRGPERNETIAVTISDSGALHESVRRFYHAGDHGRYILKKPAGKCGNKPAESHGTEADGWLASTVTIQADHPDIKELALKLRAGHERRCDIIDACNSYVFKTIHKEHVATFSNAYETLKSGKGDCGEHAALLAALLRACGIESAVVMGLVYSRENGGYFYHAWVAAYSGTLLFADPALGPFPAVAGYIPLVIDTDGSNLMQLAGIIGRIQINYVPIPR